jgi:Protein of unknown function (DUF1353)
MTTTVAAANTEERLGFDPECEVEVRQEGEEHWVTLSPITYRAARETFVVPANQGTDFASVPRYFVWLIPRYGRYTKAAILHDYLCRVAVENGTISRADADGVFRQAMRTLGVGFLRRWIMWAAVRLSVVTTPAGRRRWLRDSWQVLPIGLVMLPVLAPAALVIILTLEVFWFVEMLVWLVLLANCLVNDRANLRTKRVNRPTLSLHL